MHSVNLLGYQLPLVREVGYMEDSEGIMSHPDRLMPNLHVFLFVESGQIEVIEDDIHYQVKAGGYLFLRKGIKHWGVNNYLPNTHWYYIHFYDGPNAEQPLSEYRNFQATSFMMEDVYMQQLTLPKHGLVQQTAFFTLQLDKISDQSLYSEEFRPLILSQLTYQLFLDLYQYSKQENHHPRHERIVAQITAFCRNAETKPTSKEISDHLNRNYAYISTIFRTETGKSIRQFQNELLIERAMKLLSKTELNVAQVSDQLGFANPFYFSRVFKKVTGISPSAYLDQRYQS